MTQSQIIAVIGSIGVNEIVTFAQIKEKFDVTSMYEVVVLKRLRNAAKRGIGISRDYETPKIEKEKYAHAIFKVEKSDLSVAKEITRKFSRFHSILCK